MDAQAADRGVLGFGPFLIDTARRQLTRDGARIHLTPRLFDTLAHLAANAGRVVDKDELMRAVWGERVVEEANLSQTVFALRKTLREAGLEEEAIVTAPGRGYRFVLPVAQRAFRPEGQGIAWPGSGAGEGAGAASGAQIEVERGAAGQGLAGGAAAQPPARALTPARLGLAGLVAAAAMFAIWRGQTPAAPPVEVLAPHSVAILPLADLSASHGQAYFAAGLSEALIDSLARIETLHVAARTSAFSFQGGHATVPEIGRALHVGTVLEGSVREEGGHVRVGADLIDAASGFMLWRHEYDASAQDAIKLQAGIAEDVAGALKVKLGLEETGLLTLGGTQNPAAYDDFLHGIGEEAQNQVEARSAARDWFAAAVAKDPDFAQAQAALAREISWLANHGPQADAKLAHAQAEEAQRHARRAIALAPKLADGYAALAGILEDSLEFGAAYEAITTAARLDPGNAAVLRQFGQMAGRMGHAAEGRAAEQHSAELDPLSPGAYFGLAVMGVIEGRYDEVSRNLARLQAMTGHLSPIAMQLATVVALKKGDWQGALHLAEGFSGWPHDEYRAIALYKLGRAKEAADALSALHQEMGDNGNFQYAEVLASTDRPAEALAALQAAYAQRDAGLIDLRASPFLEPVRGSEGYRALMGELHFPQ